MSLSKIPFYKSDYFFFRPISKGSYRGNVIFGSFFKTTKWHLTKDLIKQTSVPSSFKVAHAFLVHIVFTRLSRRVLWKQKVTQRALLKIPCSERFSITKTISHQNRRITGCATENMSYSTTCLNFVNCI